MSSLYCMVDKNEQIQWCDAPTQSYLVKSTSNGWVYIYLTLFFNKVFSLSLSLPFVIVFWSIFVQIAKGTNSALILSRLIARLISDLNNEPQSDPTSLDQLKAQSSCRVLQTQTKVNLVRVGSHLVLWFQNLLKCASAQPYSAWLDEG